MHDDGVAMTLTRVKTDTGPKTDSKIQIPTPTTSQTESTTKNQTFQTFYLKFSRIHVGQVPNM